jgi:hypothetical protein
MSRHQLSSRNPRFEVFVGWDPPLQSYFLQVYDLEAAPDTQPGIWRGALEKLSFAELVAALPSYAPLSHEMASLLVEDGRFDRG